jgi:hypothetical protein
MGYPVGLYLKQETPVYRRNVFAIVVVNGSSSLRLGVVCADASRPSSSSMWLVV